MIIKKCDCIIITRKRRPFAHFCGKWTKKASEKTLAILLRMYAGSGALEATL